MSKPAIRVSEARSRDFPSLLTRVCAGAEVVIERNAEAVAVVRPAAPNVRLLSESLRLAKERGANADRCAALTRPARSLGSGNYRSAT